MTNKVYKYRLFNEYTNNIIISSSLYFSPIKAFNDPYDCNLSFKKEYSKEEISKYFEKEIEKSDREKIDSIKEAKDEHSSPEKFHRWIQSSLDENVSKYGILSLSSTKKSILMWSHYSYNHTGLVFEFDILEDRSFFKYLAQVSYEEKKYDLLSHTDYKNKDIKKLLLTKYKDWEYEQEHRIIDLKFQGEKEFNKMALKTVIFGAKAKADDIEKFIKLCDRCGFSHLKFKKAKLVDGKFKLSFHEY